MATLVEKPTIAVFEHSKTKLMVGLMEVDPKEKVTVSKKLKEAYTKKAPKLRRFIIGKPGTLELEDGSTLNSIKTKLKENKVRFIGFVTNTNKTIDLSQPLGRDLNSEDKMIS